MSLGREIAPAVTIGRPKFRHYPGPASGAILAIPFAGVAVWGFTTFRGALSPGFYWFLAGCAGLLVLLSLVTTFFWLRFGVTLSLRELGVVIGTRGKEYELRYADIDSITIRDRRRYDERAIVRVLTRTVIIEAADAGRASARQTVKAEYVAPPDFALEDELNYLAGRVAAEQRPHAGKGWSIEQGTLVVRGDRVPLSSITAAGVFERDVRLWKHNDEEHFFSVPFESKNARVLLALAEQRASAAEAVAQPSPSAGIGRLLFSRQTTFISGAGNTLMVAFVLAMAWVGMDKYLRLPVKLSLGITIGAFVLWIFYSLYRLTVRYRFHERAVVRTSILGTRTLSYSNVASVTWNESAASLEHAIPLGTTVKAKLVPDDGSPAMSIRLHRMRGTDGDLEPVRSAIAHHVADKLWRDVERGGEAQWTSNARFTREGLVVKQTLFRYDETVGFYFQPGFLVFYRDNPRKPLALLSASDPNFYPGWALFHTVMRNYTTLIDRTA